MTAVVKEKKKTIVMPISVSHLFIFEHYSGLNRTGKSTYTDLITYRSLNYSA